MLGYLAMALLGTSVPLAASKRSKPAAPEFSEAQIDDGENIYDQSCAVCHGFDLTSGQYGPALRGDVFAGHFVDDANRKAISRTQLAKVIQERMPPGQPGSLSDIQTGSVTAYILKQNQIGDTGKR